MKKILCLALICGIAACDSARSPEGGESSASIEAAGSNKIATSGKRDVPIDQVPAQVLAAATAARPGFTAKEAESESREGRNYFDIGGTLPDGSEVEFDIMEEGGRWRIVETQRDIELSAAPAAVRQASAGFEATRVIESTQSDGLVIFELYDATQRKLEIKWDGSRAEVLTQEWAH